MEKVFTAIETECIYKESQRLGLEDKTVNALASLLANFKKNNTIQVNILLYNGSWMSLSFMSKPESFLFAVRKIFEKIHSQ